MEKPDSLNDLTLKSLSVEDLMVYDTKVLELPQNCLDYQFKRQFIQLVIYDDGDKLKTIDKGLLKENRDKGTFGTDLLLASQIFDGIKLRGVKDELSKIEDTSCQLTEFCINFEKTIPEKEDLDKFLVICSNNCSRDATKYIYTMLMKTFNLKKDTKIIIGEKTLYKGSKKKYFSVFQFR